MISAARPRAYSYIRFSKLSQRKGDSLARQEQLRQGWLDRNPEYHLDDTLQLHDLGVSAFKSKNATHGRLAAFIAAVDDGQVLPGSVLLVESLDRLSRDQIGEALQLFLRLLGAGIIIVTLSPTEERFDKASINDLPKILMVLVTMCRAHEESAMKSERIGKARDTARKHARENGKLVTRQVPAWVEVTKDGKRIEIRAAADTVRMIFQLALEGMSLRAIETRLNATAPWIPSPKRPTTALRDGHGWRTSYIRKILANRAVLGEYQPHKLTDGKRQPTGDPILGYFPAVVPPDLFHAVQQRRASNRTAGGRTGVAGNVLTHLIKCAYCGGPMRYVDKGKPPKGAKYLICDYAVRGVRNDSGERVCTRHPVRYDECVELLLYNCRRLRPGDVLPKADDQAKVVRGLNTRLQGTVARLAEVETQLANLTERVGDAPSKESADRIFKLIEAKEQDKATLVAQRDATEAELRKAETSTRSFVQWRDDLEALHDAIHTGGPETRLRLRSHLQDFIERVEVFAVGEPGAYKPVRLHAKPIVAWTKDFEIRLRKWETFDAYLEGRFYRVHFKCGTVADLIPRANGK